MMEMLCVNIPRGAMCRRNIGIETRCGLRDYYYYS